jgi:hypothetical protein
MADAEELARKLHEEIRRRVLRRALFTDASVVKAFEDMARRLRARLRSFGTSDAEVARALQEEFRRTEAVIMPHVEAAIEEAAGRGDESARRTLALIRGGADRSEGGQGPFAQRLESRAARSPGHSPPSESADD